MTTLRWEIIPSVLPWAQPQATLLGAPIASGAIRCQDWDSQANAAVTDPAAYAPSAPVLAPASPEGASFHVLRLEAFGGRGWYVSIGTPEHPPQAGDGFVHDLDPVACIYVPGNTEAGFVARGVEVRAIRPGSSFIAWPLRNPS